MLRFHEGFENSAEVACYNRKWAAAINGQFTTGRLHGQAMRGSFGVTTEWRTRSLGLQNSWRVGFGFRHPNATVVDSTTIFPIVVKRGVDQQIHLQWRKGTGNTFYFEVFRGATSLGTTPEFVPQTWHYFEFGVTVDPVSGSFELRHNTVNVLSNAGPINTADTGLAGADVFEISFGADFVEIDDLYILDTTTAINNDFLGDSVIEGRRPTSDSAPLQWTLDNGGAGLTQHYEALDAQSCSGSEPNQFVFSDTVGHQDLLAFTALTFITGQVHGVMVASDARLDVTGTREFKHIVRSNGTLYTSPTGGITHTVAATAYQTFYDMLEVDPDTGVKWTLSGINNAEFGLEVVS